METAKVRVTDVKQEITPFATPNGEEVRKVTITVDGIGDRPAKLKFYSHKKGTDDLTKAYLGFKTGGVVKGAYLEVGYNEQDKEFTNDEGKNIKFKERWVSFFDKLSNEPVSETKPEQPVEGGSEISIEDVPF